MKSSRPRMRSRVLGQCASKSSASSGRASRNRPASNRRQSSAATSRAGSSALMSCVPTSDVPVASPRPPGPGIGAAEKTPLQSLGATRSLFNAAAAATSPESPQSISSLPDTLPRSVSRRRGAAFSWTAIAAAASGDRLPSRLARIAPAPTWSSMDGRRSPCGHCSPQATTATRGPQRRVASTTAHALRRRPANVGVGPVVNDRVALLGDGSTMRLPS